MIYLICYVAGGASVLTASAIIEWFWPLEIPEDSYYTYVQDQLERHGDGK
jgi:hypothetical protein